MTIRRGKELIEATPRKHPIETILDTAIERLGTSVKMESIIGEPFVVGTKTIVPLSKVCVGFVAGGGEYLGSASKPHYPVSGGSGGGYSIVPIGFLVVDGDKTTIVGVNEKSAYEQLLGLVPKTLGAVTQGLMKGKNCCGKEK
ncbi:MAG: hypothetical protein FWD89_05160 [Firmicutes bacterium]|nr:hypothetical protein [Bacillota bacterium]